MRPSLLPPSLRDYTDRGTVTETVVPGDAADVVTRPPSCRVSASTMLVPRPNLAGASQANCFQSFGLLFILVRQPNFNLYMFYHLVANPWLGNGTVRRAQ